MQMPPSIAQSASPLASISARPFKILFTPPCNKVPWWCSAELFPHLDELSLWNAGGRDLHGVLVFKEPLPW